MGTGCRQSRLEVGVGLCCNHREVVKSEKPCGEGGGGRGAVLRTAGSGAGWGNGECAAVVERPLTGLDVVVTL